ncbi:hybrid sensor histidine kinase/response regulator [Capnocytophaga cynodegmi]|uniref:histidine kinase n=1 Tax=Capnocytophaga cynodegmi TaxID=28189 RepID=A0A250E5F3_9FLAO|nr:ATP-binding protein [Capnocytophaga cynodegmi]ATA68150.1 hybrid sensor histidine kinase/response regulator [Capnocytophaga cynodegmi]
MEIFFNKGKPFFLLCVFIFFNACFPKKEEVKKDDLKKEYSEILNSFSKREDSLQIMLHKQIDAKNDVGVMLSYKYLGKNQRENAKFSEAIESHQEYLELALKIKDTVEIIQAFNDLGTDFRRIGAMSEASNYHYEALRYADAYSDVKNSGRKARVVALNGIGNISHQLGYLSDAERYFREALAEETALKSDLGQAINYANIGSVFRSRQEYDSARVYYQHSLEKNIKANSEVGIGLCYIHLGNLYRIEKKFNLAEKEYQKAYDLMESFADKWHWLNACVALATIYQEQGSFEKYTKYVQLAEKVANQIGSMGHISEINMLKYNQAIKQHNFRDALESYKKSMVMRDSVQGIRNTNHYMDLRVNYEREQNTRRLKQVEATNIIKEREKQFILKITWAIILVSILILGLLYYAYYQRAMSNRILKNLEKARTDFFTNLTHEFRTPLTVIQGLNRQLQNRKDLSEKEKSKFMESIARQSSNLLNLVNQLLDITKLKSGTEKPEWKRDDIVPYLQMTAETFRLYAEERNINLIFYTDVAKQEMDFVPFYIDKIVGNLLSNAIKHTEDGDKIDFIVVRGSKPNTIIIRVIDNGEGIPKEELTNIFELFYQNPNARNTSGTGIGLAFTKMLVEKMHGKITVESELGKGTTFSVTLPLRNRNLKDISSIKTIKKELMALPNTPKDEIEEEVINSESVKHSESPKILVVEDNKDVTLYIKSLLEANYTIITAKNGKEGIELAEKCVPDLVITDVMMPIKNGYELCKEMKDSVLLNHIPIIMLTAKTSEQDRLQGLKYGVEAYIQKPFSSKELLVWVKNILQNRKVLKEKYLSIIESGNPQHHLHNDENLKFLQKVIKIIHSEMNNPDFNATFVADKMSISPSQLSRKLNQITGFSTSSYILKVKLNKAKKMLHDTSITLGEVADVCGFYDSSYFSRVFKKEFGITPSQYQKNVAMNVK